MGHEAEYPYLYRQNILIYLESLNEVIKREYPNKAFNVLLAGGSSLILTHNFRQSTEDIDAYWENQRGLKKCINTVSKMFSLTSDWMNNDFTKSSSFSINLVSNADLVVTYSNLIVYKVCDLDLFCMKLVSLREKDKLDLVGLVKDFNGCYTQYDVANRLEFLYGSDWTFKLSEEAKRFVRLVLRG